MRSKVICPLAKLSCLLNATASMFHTCQLLADKANMTRALLLLLALIYLPAAEAQRVGVPTDDLNNLSVDDLFQLEVTSVDRKAQQLSKAPASIYVLTAEDIRRSGASSIPEALQWVPGLTVLHVAGGMWAVSARGDARLYSDKMLVMVDGRSLYTPLFSGVLWDLVDVPLDNIERIEIVRGPGAVMWGLNAVNGVINIITKKAERNKGATIDVASGNGLRGSVFARWSDTPTDRLAYQVWLKMDDENPAFSSPGFFLLDKSVAVQSQPVDNLRDQSARIGFRLDGELSDRDQLVIQGDAYRLGRHDELGFPILMPGSADYEPAHTSSEGGYLQARWTRTNAAGNESSLQFTYNRDDIDYPIVSGNLNNLTADFQQSRHEGERNELYWGLGFEHYWDDSLRDSPFIEYNPSHSSYGDGDAVLRDELQLIPDHLLASAGLRVDYDTNTHFEFQPSFRLLFTPNSRQSLWFALSRAARVPNRTDRDMNVNDGAAWLSGLPMNITIQGSHAVHSEIERSIEAGYRLQSGQRWSLDTSIFWSYYNRLVGVAMPQQPQIVLAGGVPTLWLNGTEQNIGTGRSYGAETSATWQVSSRWRLLPGYSYVNETKWLPQNDAWLLSSSSPRHQGWLRSQLDFSRKWQVDLMGRARSRSLPFETPGVLLLDARLEWRPLRNTEISLSVQDLTGRTVLETYSESPFVAIPTQRTFVFRWVQRF